MNDELGMIEKLQELAARLDAYKVKIDRMKSNGMFTEKAVDELRKKAYNEIVSEKEAILDERIKLLDGLQANAREQFKPPSSSPEAELLKLTKLTNKIKAMPTDALVELAQHWISGSINELIDEELTTQELIDTYVAELRSRNERTADDLFNHAYQVVGVAEPWKYDKDYGKIESQKQALEGLKAQKDIIAITDGINLKAVEVAGLARGLTSDAFNSISRNIRVELAVPPED